MTPAQRDVLISHIDGPCEVVLPLGGRAGFSAPYVGEIARRWQTTASLIMCGFLRGDPGGAARPRRTIMTLAGREALAKALAVMAEVLVAAGYGLEPPDGWTPEVKPSVTLPTLSFRGHMNPEDRRAGRSP